MHDTRFNAIQSQRTFEIRRRPALYFDITKSVESMPWRPVLKHVPVERYAIRGRSASQRTHSELAVFHNLGMSKDNLVARGSLQAPDKKFADDVLPEIDDRLAGFTDE